MKPDHVLSKTQKPLDIEIKQEQESSDVIKIIAIKDNLKGRFCPLNSNTEFGPLRLKHRSWIGI